MTTTHSSRFLACKLFCRRSSASCTVRISSSYVFSFTPHTYRHRHDDDDDDDDHVPSTATAQLVRPANQRPYNLRVNQLDTIELVSPVSTQEAHHCLSGADNINSHRHCSHTTDQLVYLQVRVRLVTFTSQMVAVPQQNVVLLLRVEAIPGAPYNARQCRRVEQPAPPGNTVIHSSFERACAE